MTIKLFEYDIVPQSESSTEVELFGYNLGLPDDLLLDVLSRLPAKTLGRFRCVSKSWGSLLVNTNRYFSNMYLNNISTDYSTMIIVSGLSQEEPDLYTIDCKTKDIKKLNYPPSIKRYIPNKNYKIFYPMIDIEGSINGVLFIRSNYQEIGIWNPLSQRYQKISCPPRVSPPLLNLEPVITYGFGYEKTSDDYKVVALLNFWNNGSVLPDHYHGWIYSLNINTWKRLENFSYDIFSDFDNNGVFCSGALHWITEDMSILGFNLINETFYLVPKPPTTPWDAPHLSVLGGCLAFSGEYDNGSFEIWVMNKYGIKDSWSKINFDYDILQNVLECWCVQVMPVSYLVKRRVLILQIEREKLPQMIILYDLLHHSVEIILDAPIYDDWNDTLIVAYPYVETLECFDHHEK